MMQDGKRKLFRLRIPQMKKLEVCYQINTNWSKEEQEKIRLQMDIPTIKVYKWLYDRNKRSEAGLGPSRLAEDLN